MKIYTDLQLTVDYLRKSAASISKTLNKYSNSYIDRVFNEGTNPVQGDVPGLATTQIMLKLSHKLAIDPIAGKFFIYDASGFRHINELSIHDVTGDACINMDKLNILVYTKIDTDLEGIA